ncbi:GrpB family protein [Actinomadura luteofluorescens]|uniref:GrpB family protein n=1 Tax=Actinomadura luteofluorescens TaxID=46163 RepID=UPI002164A2D3|nr:GrpB family protein [Actinomadura glauciflava]
MSPDTGALPGAGRRWWPSPTRHDEQVAVDADPRRPANVRFHPLASPVWREMLLLRDWLRADRRHRDEYASLKRALAGRPGHDVDDYGRDKMPWISRALAHAERWARREPGPGPSDRP